MVQLACYQISKRGLESPNCSAFEVVEALDTTPGKTMQALENEHRLYL
jgi:hypothetical protein